MTRRRESRRRQRPERRERGPADAREVAAPEPSSAKPGGDAGISVMGVAGGLSGLVPMAALAVIILVDPGGASRLYAIVFVIGAAFFVPVTWASFFPGPRRVQVQKAAVYGCLLIAAVTAVILQTLQLAVLLAVPTTLLSIASGIIFQGTSRTRK